MPKELLDGTTDTFVIVGIHSLGNFPSERQSTDNRMHSISHHGYSRRTVEQINQSTNQLNFYNSNIPGEPGSVARQAKSVFNSKSIKQFRNINGSSGVASPLHCFNVQCISTSIMPQ